MKATIALSVLNESITQFINLARIPVVVSGRLAKVVSIHKIISRVIWRININHLDFTKIILSNKFENFKVISFDIQIFCIIKVNTSFSART